MPADVTVSTASAGEWPAIRELLTAAGLPTADLGPGAMQQFVLARNAAAVVAAIALQPADGDGLLRSLVVDPDWRGKGLGMRLVNAVEQEAHRRGIQELWLLTNDAGRFFRQLGYARAAREQAPEAITESAEFRELCPATAELYRKRLARIQD